MSDDKSDEDAPKGVDLSKLAGEMNDKEHPEIQGRLEELIDGDAETNKPLSDTTEAFLIRQAMSPADTLRDAFKANGLDPFQHQIQDDLSKLEQSGIRSYLSTLARMDVSRFCAAPSARLGHFSFEGDRTFPA